MRRKFGILAVVFLTTIPVWSLALLSVPPKPLFILQAEDKFSDGSVAFSRSGRYLAFCTGAGVTLCQITEDRQIKITAELPIAATSVAFTHDSKSLLTPSGPEGVLVLDTHNGQLMDKINFTGRRIDQVVASPVDDSIAVIHSTSQYSDWKLEIIRLRLPNPRRLLNTWEENPNRHPVFSADGKYLAHAATGKAIDVWQSSDWNKVHTIATNAKHAVPCTFDPSGETLAFADGERTCRIRSLKENRDVRTLEAPCRIHDLAFHPSGDLVALCNYPPQWISERSATAIVWDSAGSRSKSFHPFGSFARGLKISAEGQYLAIGGDAALKIWDWKSIVGNRRAQKQ